MSAVRFNDGPAAAVVVGLDCITGLQSARILARHGIPVVGVATDARHSCTRTRAVREVIEANTAGDELIQALTRLGARFAQRAVLYPCTDASVLQLARHREQLQAWYHIALPKTATVELLMDKLRFDGLAQELGLPIPRVLLLQNRSSAERAAETLPFPCILKPALKTRLWEQHSRTKVHRAETPEELLRLYDRFAPYADGLMAQQWIEGSDATLFSCNCYFDRNAEPLVTFVARKLRQWPPRTGTSCLGEECRNDTVLDLTLRLFRATTFHGLGYLEVKRDSRTGEHYIIEPNVGRPTGRSAIAEAGGVELLYTMYCDLVGLPLPSGREQRYGGAKWIYWRQDVRSAFYYWRRGELSLQQWADSWRGKKACAVFSWSDPVPFIADLARVSARLPARRLDLPSSSPAGAEPLQSKAKDRKSDFEYDLHGVVGIRLVDALPADRAAVEQHLGSGRSALNREPDITLRFVDRLPTPGLRYVEVDRSGFTDDGFFIRSNGTRAAWVRVPFENLGGTCEFVCERGLRAVPLLKPVLRLTALRRGYVPFHSSAFEWQGQGVLVAGWTHGGKTSALLAFGEQGARYVGDDLVLLAADGSRVLGVPAPLRLSDWHLGQLPHARRALGRRQLALIDSVRWLDDVGRRAAQHSGGRTYPVRLVRTALGRLQQRLKVEVPLETVFPAGTVLAAEPRKLFLMVSDSAACVSVEPANAQEIAERMSHSLRFEGLQLLSHYLAYRFAAAGAPNELIERMHELEHRLLRRALAPLEAYVVRHPYPANFRDLYEAMRPFCEPARPHVSARRKVAAQ